MHKRVGWFHQTLDIDAMRRAVHCLIGEHDFSAFRAAECQARTPVKVMRELQISRRGEMIRFDFAADAFLRHMVRNIVGSLVYIGSGRQPSEWLDQLLQSRDRTLAAPTFSLPPVCTLPRWSTTRCGRCRRNRASRPSRTQC